MLNKLEGIKIKRRRPKTRWMNPTEGDWKKLRVVNWRRNGTEKIRLKEVSKASQDNNNNKFTIISINTY